MSRNPQEAVQDLVGSLMHHTISRRTFMNRAAALGLSGAAIGSILQACGGSSSSSSGSQSGQITVWTWPDNDKTFAKTIPLFNQQYPNIKVKVEAYPNADTDYADKLLTAILSGSGPDVAMVEINVVAKFKTKPGFVDLSQAPYSAAQYKSNYAAYSWNYVSDSSTGKIFALPKNTGPAGMFYRRDVFAKAGLPTEPDQVHSLMKDWDTFISVGKKLAVKNTSWLVGVPTQFFNSIIAQAGLSYYDQSGKLQLSNPTFKTAMEYTRQAWDAGLISPFAEWSNEWGAAMQSGSVSTWLYGNWLGGSLKDTYAANTSGKWGVAYAPAYQNVTAFDSGGDFIGILESSQNKDLAWEFIKFVTQGPDSLKTMYLQNDLYPAWAPALSQSWINTSDAYYNGQNVNQIFSQVQKDMKPPTTNPNDSTAITALQNALTSITKGNVSIDTALATAQQQINAQAGS